MIQTDWSDWIKGNNNQEGKLTNDFLFNDAIQPPAFGDQKLNNIAAYSYNVETCTKIFSLIEKSLNPKESSWKSINKGLLLLKTILLYGSASAVDIAIQNFRTVEKLKTYNSALVGFFTGGMDYGAPVRQLAKELCDILINDEEIRSARKNAQAGNDSLVPVGFTPVVQDNKPVTQNATFGQGVTSSVGAGFGLEAVPGMYDGRPERYFDRDDDKRHTVRTGDHQITREAFAPDLLDMAFNNDGEDDGSSNLPEPIYLPMLEKQKAMEKQIADQKAQLELLLSQSNGNNRGGHSSAASPLLNPLGMGQMGGPGPVAIQQQALGPMMYGSVPFSGMSQNIGVFQPHFVPQGIAIGQNQSLMSMPPRGINQQPIPQPQGSGLGMGYPNMGMALPQQMAIRGSSPVMMSGSPMPGAPIMMGGPSPIMSASMGGPYSQPMGAPFNLGAQNMMGGPAPPAVGFGIGAGAGGTVGSFPRGNMDNNPFK